MTSSLTILLTTITILTTLHIASAYSGLPPPSCGINPDRLGCNSFINKDNLLVDRFDQDCYHDEHCRASCNETGKIMPWCGPPIFVPEKYRLTRKDGKSSYVPGETVVLQLETFNLGEQYRGLVMYAVNNVDDDLSRVGDWEILKSDVHFIKVDSSAPDCERTVIHKGAAEKPLITFFRFIAPESGTGDITFKAMVKTGNANTGEFYLPNSEYLMLTEEEGEPENLVLSAPGQSCTAACGETGFYCDEEETTGLGRADSDKIVSNYPCTYPLLSTCENDTPFTDGGFCYYRTSDSDCNVRQLTCDEESSASRLCVCGAPLPEVSDSDSENNSENDSEDDESEEAESNDISSGIRMNPSVILASIFFFLCAFTSKRNSALIVVVAIITISVLIPHASAHNWLVTGARAAGTASRVFPCQAARSSKPHIQVATGQRFHLEWATGHGRSVYFVIVSKEDEAFLNEHSTTVFDEYIQEALDADENNNLVMQEQYQKQHRAFRSNPDASVYSPTSGTQFPRADTCQIQKVGRTYQTFFYPEENFMNVNSDRGHPDAVILGFQSTKYSWIKGIWRYEIEFHNPSDVDVAEFYIPEEFDAGNYIIHYWWSGYYDCIDVNVVDQEEEVELPCGNRTGELEQMRIDHCVFPEPTAYFGPPIKVIDGDYEPCLQKCNRHLGQGCSGTMFFPMNLDGTHVPQSLKDYFIEEYGIKSMNETQWPGVILGNGNPPGFDIQRPDRANFGSWCRATDFCNRIDTWHEIYDNTAKNRADAQLERERIIQMFRDATPEDLYCIPVQGRPLTDTEDTLYTTSDPRNPAFYSTCFSTIPKINFPGFGDIELGGKLGPYVFEDLCLDCESRKAAAGAIISPTWTVLDGISQECEDCNSLENFDQIPEPEAIVPEYDMHVAIPNTKCRTNRDGVVEGRMFDDRPDTNGDNLPFNDNDFRNQRGVDGGCPTDTICTILLGAKVGWGPADGTYNIQTCARLASENEDCDLSAVWIENAHENLKLRRFRADWGCRCMNKLACCGGCELVRDTQADLFTITKTPEGIVAGRQPFTHGNCTVAGGTLSDDGNYCCDGRCSVCDRNEPRYPVNYGSDLYSCDRDEIDDLNTQRREGRHYCDEVGPPCVMTHLRPE